MKHVYKTHEIAHLWANKKQEDARNPHGNFFFRNGVIYSYGEHFPIARHVNDSVIFMTTRSYSNTTSKHISKVWHSIPSNKIVFKVRDVTDAPDIKHLEAYLAEMEILKKNSLNSLTRGKYYQGSCNEVASMFVKYCATFKLKKKVSKLYRKMDKIHKAVNNPSKEILTKWKRAEERAEYRRTHAEEIHKIKIANWEHAQALKVNQWRDGENVTVDSYSAPMMLRPYSPVYQGTYTKIQTIRGAEVGIESARILYEMIKAGRDIKGHVIDGYTVISLNGSLKIGCHDIPLSEVDRMATLLNWK